MHQLQVHEHEVMEKQLGGQMSSYKADIGCLTSSVRPNVEECQKQYSIT